MSDIHTHKPCVKSQQANMADARRLLERAAGWAIKVEAGLHPDANLRRRLIDDILAFLDKNKVKP